MARINLLPWRAERRRQRQKESLIMLGLSALAAVALSFLIISYYSGQISGQTERNDFLKAQISQLDTKIAEIKKLDAQKAKLLARKDVIEKLQTNRSRMVHLFDSLVRTIPDGVVLTFIKQDNETLTLDGLAQSNARVSTYLRSLEGSGWMSQPDLSIIEARGTDKNLPYAFRLRVKLANPNAPKDEDGDGIPDEPLAVDDAALLTDDAGVAPLPDTPASAPGPTEPAPVDPAVPAGTPAAPAPVPAVPAQQVEADAAAATGDGS